VDLARIKGTGPDGSIRRRDVLQAIEAQGSAEATPAAPAKEAAPAPSAPAQPATPAQLPTGSIPLRGAMSALVKHMEESLQVPTATSFRTVRVDVLDRRRRQLNQGIQAAGRPEKVSYTHLVAFATVRAVKDVPSMAISFDRVDGVPTRVARGVHFGLAVDVQRLHEEVTALRRPSRRVVRKLEVRAGVDTGRHVQVGQETESVAPGVRGE